MKKLRRVLVKKSIAYQLLISPQLCRRTVLDFPWLVADRVSVSENSS